MEDESQVGKAVKVTLGALGLGAIAAVVVDRHYGIWVAVAILFFGLLLFGGYYLWWRTRSRRQREQFNSAVEAQATATPRAISDPKKRADLDKVRGKFQTGLQEFKSRGKDIYKLPWYVIIGESGSGKTEAIRNSDIEFPAGLNKEHQGSGGTVNMDWWFTNRGVILDTAGSMVFPEAGTGDAPEWQEFLRLLRKCRPRCPVNGLFLVLSVESLIKDSAEKISQKASRLTQQLDLIQRTLDVRFPVYLLVTKCDLLTGFREFFDTIADPLLQHQMFGWSNPDPLDTPFRPDLIEQHLGEVAERLRRRRLALLRESDGGGQLGDTTQFGSFQLGRSPSPARRLDEVDALFALPESVLRLAPRLRRYLETVFVGGEWSAKPVFLRGIYFTSSMREGRALDEAIAFATGLSLDQLPEDRPWEKNRAFFLRDLFHEKVFRESGLVTNATNTLKLSRTRKLVLFGSLSVALLLLLGFAWYGKSKLGKSVEGEASYWAAGTNGWDNGEWLAGSLVKKGEALRFSYEGTNTMQLGKKKPTAVLDFHVVLKKNVETKLGGGGIFKPISVWLPKDVNEKRTEAQRALFEAGILKPLIRETRAKMTKADVPDGGIARQSDALLALLKFELEKSFAGSPDSLLKKPNAETIFKALLAYLTEDDNFKPDSRLAGLLQDTYPDIGWPPDFLFSGSSLKINPGLNNGLEKLRLASGHAQTSINQKTNLLNEFVLTLKSYHREELAWPTDPAGSCLVLSNKLQPLKEKVVQQRLQLQAAFPAYPLTNLPSLYYELEKSASNASASTLILPVEDIARKLEKAGKSSELIKEIGTKLRQSASQAGDVVRANFLAQSDSIATLESRCIPGFEWRWQLYTNLCALQNFSDGMNQWSTDLIANTRIWLVETEKSLDPALRDNQGVNLTEFNKRVVQSKQKVLAAINDYLRKHVRFPVNLSADLGNPMSREDLKGLRALLDGLSKELTNSVWQSGTRDELEVLRKNYERYTNTAALLTTEDGTPRDWEIWFVGPKEEDTDGNKTIIKVYTTAVVTMGGRTNRQDNLAYFAGSTQKVGQGSVDSKVTIRFKRLPNDPESPEQPQQHYGNWGLLQLIRGNRDGRSDNGSAWTIRMNLDDPKQNRSGEAVFEVRPGKDQRFPKFEDWK